MNLGQKGKELIQSFEKLKLVGYLPTPEDKPTIGYGALEIFGRPVVIGETITEAQADEQFLIDVAWAENSVNYEVSVTLNQNQFDALVSFVFNVGNAAFGFSTLLDLLNESKYKEAAEQFPRWNKQKGKVLNGLTKRRKAERDLFLEEVK